MNRAGMKDANERNQLIESMEMRCLAAETLTGE